MPIIIMLILRPFSRHGMVQRTLCTECSMALYIYSVVSTFSRRMSSARRQEPSLHHQSNSILLTRRLATYLMTKIVRGIAEDVSGDVI